MRGWTQNRRRSTGNAYADAGTGHGSQTEEGPAMTRYDGRIRTDRLLTSATAALVLGGGLGLAAPAQAETSVNIAVTETIASHNPYADSVALMYAVFCQTYGCLVDRDFENGGFTSRIVERWETPEPTT